MPRFHFDIHDGGDFIDDEGLDLPDIKSAEDQAIAAVTEMVRWIDPRWAGVYVTVRDHMGSQVLRVSATVKVERSQETH